jgi:GT2 family glycosyltransferase
MKKITYILTPICDVYICRFVYTLYKYSEPDSFNLVVIDQTENGFRKEVMEYLRDKVHFYMHPRRNLGYAKAMNEGIIHGLHWNTPYLCISNDDIEIMDKRWIQGIWDTFALDEKRIMGVVPMSPRVAGWGYGVSYNPEVLPYKEEYTSEEYDYLLKGDFSDVTWELPKTFPRNMKGQVVDSAAFIMVYMKREAFEKVGLLDERFFPGSGEDYDWECRAYSQGLRVVSSSYSWIWHHWSKSKDLYASGELERPYYKNRPYFADWEKLWPQELNGGHKPDVWGHYTDGDGRKIPLKRVEEVFVDTI